MAKNVTAEKLKFGDEITFRTGDRGRATEGVVVGKTAKKVVVYRPKYDLVHRISPNAIIDMAKDVIQMR